MRIQRFIALNTAYSRRKAEELVELKKVELNGKIVDKPGTLIDPLKDIVFINGTPVKPVKKYCYLMLNKPAGYITTRKDRKAKKTVMDLIPYKDLHPVGRLDKQTEGLLLLTNDGDLTYKLTHPKFEQEKEYTVEVKKPLTPETKRRFREGIVFDGKKTAPAELKNLRKSGTNWSCSIVIHEGRKRQVRRMFEEIQNPVVYLKRVRIAGITLGNLKSGEYRELSAQEIKSLKNKPC